MKLAIVALAMATFLGTAGWSLDQAVAAQGDRLSVSRQNVNIRSGPSTNADILMVINAGEDMVEIAQKGEWVYVDFPNLNSKGWIYGPLLDTPPAAGTASAGAGGELTNVAAANQITPATPPPADQAPTSQPAPQAESPSRALAPAAPAPAPEQVAAIPPGEEPAAVKTFRDTVVELNERAVSVAGINLFTDVRSIGGGGVQVLATETWTSVPEAGQESYMNALFERWQSMATGLSPLTLQILDPIGNVVMQRSDS